MTLITYFSPAPDKQDLPQAFPSPFNHQPHAIAKLAAEQLQLRLAAESNWRHDFMAADGGKMFGVLVVMDESGRIGFLSAFSGMLAGQWLLPGFVPPVFELDERNAFLPAGEAELAGYARRIELLQQGEARRLLLAQIDELLQQRDADIEALNILHGARKAERRERRAALPHQGELLTTLSYESQRDKREMRERIAQWATLLTPLEERLAAIDGEIAALKQARARLSNMLHGRLFAGYRLGNVLGETKAMADFFAADNPPGGAGDCAAPKLLQYAQRHGLKALALAEFWWGAPPREGVRHHGHYYPACRGKCRPILPFMLQGMVVQAEALLGVCADDHDLAVVYEDDDLVVVNKPAGLLSVPGKQVDDSVLMRLRRRYPQAGGPLLVHRLDMSTSGLLLAAKNAQTHKALQQQFERRCVEKRYLALLSKRLPESHEQGYVELPMRVDLDDRPRQVICYTYGKPAKTRWQVIERRQTTTRVYFYPLTGRTHQLRLHASHKDGLNAPIVGDELYGEAGQRLMLHAERLRFSHPATGQEIEVVAAAPF